MTLPRGGHLGVVLHDARGAAVRTLVDAEVGAGARLVTLDATTLAAGTYTLVVTLDGRMVSTRVNVVR